jgi:PAS domain S-box-containing protein
MPRSALASAAADYSLPPKDIGEELGRIAGRRRPVVRAAAPPPHIQDQLGKQVELEMQNRELRETQERLEEATLRYADLYDFAPVGYCTLAPEGHIREINLTGAALLGTPREQLLGKSFPSVSPLEDRRAFAAHLERCQNERARVTSELAFRIGGRGARAVHIISEPILDASGLATAYRTILIDISELKQLENKLRLLSEAGQALSSSLDFTATLKTVVRLAVPALADLCMLDMLQEDGTRSVCWCPSPTRGSNRRWPRG